MTTEPEADGTSLTALIAMLQSKLRRMNGDTDSVANNPCVLALVSEKWLTPIGIMPTEEHTNAVQLILVEPSRKTRVDPK